MNFRKELNKLDLRFLVYDSLVMLLTFWFAVILRFDFFKVTVFYDNAFIVIVPGVLVLMVLVKVGLYKRVSHDHPNILIKVGGLWSMLYFAYLSTQDLYSLPRSLAVIWPLCFVSLSMLGRFSASRILQVFGHPSRKRVAVYCESDAVDGAQKLIEASFNEELTCLISDEPERYDSSANFIVESPSRLLFLAARGLVDKVILSSSVMPADIKREYLVKLSATGVDIYHLDLINSPDLDVGGENILRKLELADFLKRDEFSINLDQIKEVCNSKNILITGAGGSIGSELVKQIMSAEPRKLVAVDNNELSLFNLRSDLNSDHKANRISYYLCDVCDEHGIKQIFENEEPNIIFHAAAYKHVDFVGHNLRSAIKNNILGTKNCADIARATRATTHFIFISSDKAVKPSSVMGATKLVGEIYIQHCARESAKKFCSVRFGNVLGSSGSVVPIFERCLKENKPLEVRGKDVERYFMTKQEAAQLVVTAVKHATGGDLFVLDMGRPVKIEWLAKQMITLHHGYFDPKFIKHTPLGPEEKITEVLSDESSCLIETGSTGILRAENTALSTNHERLVLEISDLLTSIDIPVSDELYDVFWSVIKKIQSGDSQCY